MKSNASNIAILGAGRSGLAAAALACAEGATVTVYETAPLAATQLAQQQALVENLGARWSDEVPSQPEAQQVIVSPGLDPRTKLYQRFAASGAKMIGELEFAWRRASSPAVAITGTNGKTTTTEMIGHILNSAGLDAPLGANHGKPLSEIVLETRQGGPKPDWLVLEVSSFQLELAPQFHPRVAVWTNFAPDHLDRYPDLAAYRAAKELIFTNLSADDRAVVPAVDAPATGRAQSVTFGLSDDSGPTPDFALDREGKFRAHGEVIGEFAELGVRGKHNALNALAALAAVEGCGLDPAEAFAWLSTYESAAHRYQLLAKISEIEYINDSKATNLHAMASALAADPHPLHLLVGGHDKGLDWHELDAVLPGRLRSVQAFGSTAGQIAEAWGALLPVTTHPTLVEAFAAARSIADPGDQILLSPGTSSFDQYRNYAQRGEHFSQLVEASKLLNSR